MNHLATAVGLIAGLALGLLASVTGSPVLHAVAKGVAPLGQLFINAVQMVVIPLVAAVLFAGVARLGDPRKLGRLGGSALAFIWGTTVPAILIGMGFMKAGLMIVPPAEAPAAAGQAVQELPGMVDFLLRLIPANPIGAAAQGQLLPLIVFIVVFGAAAGAIAEDKRERLLALADAVSDAFIKLVHWVLWTAPLGVLGLAAPVMAEMGWELLKSLAVFVVAVVLGLYVFMTVVYLPLIRWVGGMGPLAFAKGTVGSYTIGFSTTSSVASLPVMFEDAERLGVSATASSLALPLAASINRAGSALFQGAAIVFLAAVYNVDIPVAAIGGAVLATFLVAMTVAPVPSASVVTLAPALDAVGVPLAGMAILLGIDRIPDMFRTATNVTGHVACAVVVDGVGEAPS